MSSIEFFAQIIGVIFAFLFVHWVLKKINKWDSTQKTHTFNEKECEK